MKKFLLGGFSLILIFLVFSISRGTSEENNGPEYVGSKKCKACHKDIYKSWEEKTHAKAFQVLIDSNAAEDTTCLPCHTTGYGAPGGFVDTTSTPKLLNAGCESCHGPGSEYKKMSVMKDPEKAEAAGLIKPTEETCKICHTKKQSPEFNFEKYKERGVHEIPEE